MAPLLFPGIRIDWDGRRIDIGSMSFWGRCTAGCTAGARTVRPSHDEARSRNRTRNSKLAHAVPSRQRSRG
jgi:hypothetical protein